MSLPHSHTAQTYPTLPKTVHAALAVVTLALAACTGNVEGGASTRHDAGETPMDGGLSVTCDSSQHVTLDELWNDYFAPANPTGCAVAGCHASGAGKLEFTTKEELWAAAVGKTATGDGRLARIEPGDPARSYLYRKLLESAGVARMPLGGPYLNDAAIAAVAAYICDGAPEPGQAAADGGIEDAGPDAMTDGGSALGPVITMVTPNSGVVGTSVMIAGEGFSTDPLEDVVAFHGKPAAVSSATTTLLITSVPAGATSGPITVEVAGRSATSPSAFQVIVPSPVPVLTSVSPTGALAGAGDTTITLTGQGFVGFSVAQLDGVMLTTTYVSPTQLSAVIPEATLAVSGPHTLNVTTRGPGGGTSAGVAFQVDNPVATVSTLSPSSALVGDTNLTLTVNGAGFVATSVVMLNGANATTTFQSKTQLTVSVPEQVATGALQVSVFNPVPGGGTSNAVGLDVVNPVPQLDTLAPTSVLAGSGAAQLTLTGSHFVAGSVAMLDGFALPTTWVSKTQLTVDIDAASTLGAAAHMIHVENPAPGGGASASQSFDVQNPVPSASSIQPASVATNGAPFTLTVTGSNFNSQSVITLDGSPLTTALINATTLQAQVPTLVNAAIYDVLVTNPAPGGGSSSPALPLTAADVTGPTITGLSPASGEANLSFTLTITGSGYVCSGGNASQVFFDGSLVAIDSCSSTALDVTIPATAAGTYSVEVKNGADTTSTLFTLVAPNPTPSISALSPSIAAVGGAAFTLTVDGTDFVPGAVVSWMSTPCTTTFVSATQVTASIPAANLANVGTFDLSVTNPAPGGGESNKLTFQVVVPNPIPSVTGLSPSSVLAGSGALNVTITGTNFIASSVATFGGVEHTTHFVSATELSVELTQSDTDVGAVVPIAVTNPAPGGGTSGSFSFTVITPNPVPDITSLSQTSVIVGSAGFTLIVNGTGFIPTSSVSWSGTPKATTYVSPTRLDVSISAADITTASIKTISVDNPAPGGGTSAGVSFAVENPVPAITSLSPSAVTVGDGAFTLTVNGSGFVSSSVVKIDGSARTTQFVSANQITASLLAGDDDTVTTHAITVENPTPGGGGSASATLTVASQPNPVPSIGSLSPCGTVAGSGAFTLTINGTNFVDSSSVTFKGTAVTTTYVSATQLTAAITAGLISTAPSNDAASVIVTNPMPGGGASGSVTFGVATQAATLAAQVQPIFTASCATSMCHSASGSAPMDLSSGKAYASLVGVQSDALACRPTPRVKLCGPLRSESVLIDKILATGPSPACSGSAMPKMGSLTTADKQRIVDWVAQGAPK